MTTEVFTGRPSARPDDDRAALPCRHRSCLHRASEYERGRERNGAYDPVVKARFVIALQDFEADVRLPRQQIEERLDHAQEVLIGQEAAHVHDFEAGSLDNANNPGSREVDRVPRHVLLKPAVASDTCLDAVENRHRNDQPPALVECSRCALEGAEGIGQVLEQMRPARSSTSIRASRFAVPTQRSGLLRSFGADVLGQLLEGEPR